MIHQIAFRSGAACRCDREVLDIEYAGMAKSPWGSVSAGFSAQTRINRKDWGLNWNVALETGGWLVSDELRISIEVELVKQPAEAEAEAQAETEAHTTA